MSSSHSRSCMRYGRDSDLSENSERSSVGFSTVEFHEHRVVLGDNPSTSCGPSIEIDWNAVSSATVDVEDYESHRMPRRSKNQLIMPNQMRQDILLESGYSLREIRETSANQRRNSLTRSKSTPLLSTKKLLPKKLVGILSKR